MAKKLQFNRCWKHVRLTVGEGYIEIQEHKPRQTFIATCVMAVGLLFAMALILSISRSADFAGIFAGVVLTALPIAWVLVVYRLPRGLRLHTEQQLAQRYATVYGLVFFSRWHDLSERALEARQCKVYSMEASDGKTKSAIALTGLFAVMGGVGWLLSLGVSNGLQQQVRTAHTISIQGDDEPLAFFLFQQHVNEMVEMYGAALKNELGDYRPGPRRFEKRPGG